MDEVLDFCVRVLGPGELAGAAAEDARRCQTGERTEVLAAAAQACRARSEHAGADELLLGSESESSLAEAVARELRAATANLPERQREVLALREALALSHAQVAAVMGIEPAAVPSLMARARLALRAERRGSPAEDPRGSCEERERALRLLALRQDSEPFHSEDDDWLHTHLNSCDGCRRAHAAMLEASACYRAWRPDRASSAAARPQP